MDFITWLPKTTKKHDGIWVIVDRLTKVVHFLAIKITFGSKRLADLYIKEMDRLHGIPLNIVSNHDTKFIFGSGMDFK